MKRILYAIAASLAIVMATLSCQKEQQAPQSSDWLLYAGQDPILKSLSEDLVTNKQNVKSICGSCRVDWDANIKYGKVGQKGWFVLLPVKEGGRFMGHIKFHLDGDMKPEQFQVVNFAEDYVESQDASLKLSVARDLQLLQNHKIAMPVQFKVSDIAGLAKQVLRKAKASTNAREDNWCQVSADLTFLYFPCGNESQIGAAFTSVAAQKIADYNGSAELGFSANTTIVYYDPSISFIFDDFVASVWGEVMMQFPNCNIMPEPWAETYFCPQDPLDPTDPGINTDPCASKVIVANNVSYYGTMTALNSIKQYATGNTEYGSVISMSDFTDANTMVASSPSPGTSNEWRYNFVWDRINNHYVVASAHSHHNDEAPSLTDIYTMADNLRIVYQVVHDYAGTQYLLKNSAVYIANASFNYAITIQDPNLLLQKLDDFKADSATVTLHHLARSTILGSQEKAILEHFGTAINLMKSPSSSSNDFTPYKLDANNNVVAIPCN